MTNGDTRKGRIVVVDDSVSIRREVASTLFRSGDFEVVAECDDGFAALKALIDLKPDVVVCDLNMPHCSGAQLLRMKAARPSLEEIPVIILTSDTDVTRKVDLLELGAADYVTKPFHPRELLARVRIHHRLRVVQEQLKAANERLYDLACTDGLLGISNRRHLDKVLENEVARHVRYGLPLGLILVDVDHFKQVNDVHGHATGDAVLAAIAGTLKGLVRRADIVARYGGEEICIVLTSTGTSGAMVLAERLRAAVEDVTHRNAVGDALRVTASFGVAVADAPSAGMDVKTLLARADHALYAAKRAGRNRVVLWDDSSNVSRAAPLAHAS